MKNVLYISYDGMTDPLGQSQVLPYLIGLTEKGYTFHLISFEKENRFKEFETHIRAICDKAGINWHPLSYTKKPPLLSTIYDVQRMKSLAHKLHKNHQFKIVHCRSYIAALVGLKMKKKFGTKFLFDMRGFWADERIDGNIWKLSNPIFKSVYTYFKKKEIQFFTEADHTISLTYNGKSEIESWEQFQKTKPPIEVIPCCVDLDLFNPEKINSEDQTLKRRKIGINSKDYVLGYVGSIGTWYMLPEMLDYFKVLKQNRSNAKFLFVTGENPILITEMADQKGIDLNDIFITSCLHNEVPLLISLFNSSIFFIRPSYSKKASSPTKQAEIMAMGIPLICNSGVGDTELVVKKYHSGIVIDQFVSKKYQESINEFDNFDPTTTKEGAVEFYGLAEGVDRYARVYKLISGS